MSVKEANYDCRENSQCIWDWILPLFIEYLGSNSLSENARTFHMLGRGKSSPPSAKNSAAILLEKAAQHGHSGAAAREGGRVLELLPTLQRWSFMWIAECVFFYRLTCIFIGTTEFTYFWLRSQIACVAKPPATKSTAFLTELLFSVNSSVVAF